MVYRKQAHKLKKRINKQWEGSEKKEKWLPKYQYGKIVIIVL